MVGIIDDTDTCLRYPAGTRIKIGENSGTVRYVGEVSENTIKKELNFIDILFFTICSYVDIKELG